MNRIAFIQDFIHSTACDIIFLQETWLHESQFEIVKKIDREFLSHNVLGIKNDNTMRISHGHGGVNTLWRKTLFDETIDYKEQMHAKMADDVNDVILVGNQI